MLPTTQRICLHGYLNQFGDVYSLSWAKLIECLERCQGSLKTVEFRDMYLHGQIPVTLGRNNPRKAAGALSSSRTSHTLAPVDSVSDRRSRILCYGLLTTHFLHCEDYRCSIRLTYPPLQLLRRACHLAVCVAIIYSEHLCNIILLSSSIPDNCG